MQDAGLQVGSGFLVGNLFGIVDAGGGTGLNGVEFIGGLPDKAGRAALQLVHGRLVGSVALGSDEGHHGLGLAQVNAAIQERAPGELAGLRQPCAVTQAQCQHTLAGVSTAVELQLRHVLTGVAAGCAHDHRHAFVNALVAFDHMAVGEHVAGEGRGFGRAKYMQENLFGCITADAHNAHAALAGGRGDGRDGIVGHSSSSSSFFQ